MRKIFGDTIGRKIIIISLALGMCIALCYFSGVRYPKQSTMEMFEGGASCGTNCGDTNVLPEQK